MSAHERDRSSISPTITACRPSKKKIEFLKKALSQFRLLENLTEKNTLFISPSRFLNRVFRTGQKIRNLSGLRFLGMTPIMVALIVFWSPRNATAQFEEIHSFSGPAQSSACPHGTLITDTFGGLIGTTFGQASSIGNPNLLQHGNGSIFGLSPPSQNGGAWTYRTLYTFLDHAGPYTGVIRDSSGALYGTTYEGGQWDKGTVFRLKPPNWIPQALHSFNGMDGANPTGGLVFDHFGRLWGTTQQGGLDNQGTVFCMMFAPQISFRMVHSFTGGADGANPMAGLIPFTPSGNTLFGATAIGGNSSHSGTVYMIEGDGFSFSTIFTFSGSDGSGCSDSLVSDSTNLYGTTYTGGPPPGLGTVFKLTPSTTGWTHTLLHVFRGADGANPWGSLIFGPNGDLYGTTCGGTGLSSYGTVFKLTPPSWTFHPYPVNHPPLSQPEGGLMNYGNGKLFGTTFFGGSSNYGDVFEVP
jgi:uncharacterized repeat protein (TIGR03803 family)